MDYEWQITQYKRFVPSSTYPNTSLILRTSFILEPLVSICSQATEREKLGFT